MSERPDPNLKGKEGANCNRTACQSPGAYFYNWSTRAWYCRRCAEMIQASCFKFGDIVVFEDETLGVTKDNYWRYGP